MSSWYLLPCQCGKAVRILPKHAGETRSCECGVDMSIPTMREIRRLEPANNEQSEPSPSQPGNHWHPAMGAMFVTGIPIFLIGLGLATYFFWMGSRITERATVKPTMDEVLEVAPDMYRLDLNTISLADSVEKIWKPLSKNEELPEYIEPPHLFWRGEQGKYRRAATWASAAAVVGLILAAVPMMASGKKK